MNINYLTAKAYLAMAEANTLVAADDGGNNAQAQADGGDGSYLQSLNSLADVMVAIAAAFGIVIMAYGVIKFALAFQKMDQQGEHQAVFSIISGGILIGFSGLMTVLGAGK